MPKLAEVIPLHARQTRDIEEFLFSPRDEVLVSRLLYVLADEIAYGNSSYETRMRLHFYLGLHSHVMQRWLGLLSRSGMLNRQLSTNLADNFRSVTSSILGEDSPDGIIYYDKISALSDSLSSLLELIRSD
jgi:hypothetical protein